MGFLLNPNGYGARDWAWLLEKIKSKINHYWSRWLLIYLVRIIWGT
jgi:hypothetical protein